MTQQEAPRAVPDAAPGRAPMQALRILSQEHASLWRLAITLEQVLTELEAGAALEAPFFAAALDYLAEYVEHNHHHKEDEHLFARLRLRDAGAAALLDTLEQQHSEGAQALARLRAQLSRAAEAQAGSPEVQALVAALRPYVEALKRHIRLEERELMPRARQALTPEDWAAIDHAFLDNQDPLFGDSAQARWRELFHRVASLAPASVGLGAHEGGQLDVGLVQWRGDAPSPQPLSHEGRGALQAHGGVQDLPLPSWERAGERGTPQPPSSQPLLKIDALESCYGRIQALKGVSLEVRQGELVALVGANGAGKTTLLRTLSGVQRASAGRIQFGGEDITGLRADHRVRRGICQSPEGRQVFGPMSIEDNLRLGAYTQPPAQIEDDLERVYATFPILKEKRRLAAGTLSGGQQQMLAIGRALMGRPRLLLLDEPSMGLAPLLVQEVFNVITALRQQGMTLLLVEQNASAALAIADRAYVLETGRITLTGSGQALLNDPEVRKAYLGM